MLRFVGNKRRFGGSLQQYLSYVAAILNDAPNAVGERTTVKGWVKALRSHKANVFMDVNDGSCGDKLQVVMSTKLKPENLSWGSSVKVTGVLVSGVKGQIELVADEVQVIGECNASDGYPFLPRHRYTPDYIRQYLHFRPRTNSALCTLKVRDAATFAVHSFFHKEGFTHIHTPILTGNDCEGAGEVFRVQPENEEVIKEMFQEGLKKEEIFFNKKGFLTVSGQLHLEVAAHSLSKVFTFGPTFRAENTKSRLHLSEFYMVEAELSFVESLEPVLLLIENLIKHVVRVVFEQCPSEVKFLRGQDNLVCEWLNLKFPVLSYDEAVDILNKNKDKFQTALKWGEPFTKEHELLLVELMNGVPTFVIDWPKHIKPFYMRTCSQDPQKVSALDLLAPISGELAGGSLRENDYNSLKQRLPSEELKWYLDLRKYGGVPTGGFGLGFERLIQNLCFIPNIKDTIPFPRWPHNCPT